MNKIAIRFLCLYSILILSSSCTVEKRKYLSGYNFEWRNEQSTSIQKKKQVKDETNQDSLTINEFENIVVENGLTDNIPDLLAADLSSASNVNITENLNPKADLAKYFFKADTSGKCDNIIQANGEEIAAIVTEVGTEEIRYKKCDTPDGPVYVLKKSEVFMIKFTNGTKDVITPKSQKQSAPKVEDLALVGLLFGIGGLIIFGIPFGILAIIFGAVSYGRIKKSPEIKKGKGLAIASIILGLIDIVAVFALLAFVL